MKLPVGTKSLLFGAHQFILHPILVFLAWWQLYGFPLDPRLWLVFLIHDWGYWGKPNMDGPEGETHVEWAANVMRRWFGDEWGDLCLYHSRFYAKRAGRQFSRLCVADKWVIVMEPWWFYLPRVRATGELIEYRKISSGQSGSKYGNEYRAQESDQAWCLSMQLYCAQWVAEFRYGAPDIWTLSAPSLRPCDEETERFGQMHSPLDQKLSGHAWHCPKCDNHLTSLGLCAYCGKRYDLPEAA